MTQEALRTAQSRWVWARSRIFICLLILAATGLISGWMMARAEQRLRNDFISRTHLLAGAINLNDVQKLTGTEADLNSPAYLRLKTQFIALHAAQTRARFIYLMGQRADGTVFFFVDNEPEGSVDESPAGQTYNEVTDDELLVFETQSPRTMGPFVNRWGTWIASQVPLIDPETGRTLAVLGMDIDASDWRWHVAGEAALPIGLLFLLAIGLLTLVFTIGRTSTTAKPVMRRLMPGLSIIFLLLIAGGYWTLTSLHENHLRQRSLLVNEQAVAHFEQLLKEQALGMDAALISLFHDADLIAALKANDRDRLLDRALPLFDDLHARHAVTHMYLSDAQRTCLLRAHNPKKNGDRIDRFTTLEAERTGKMEIGIEIDPSGAIIHRVVRPLFEDGNLLGYVELGKDLQNVLNRAVTSQGVERILAIQKNLIDRTLWESKMATRGVKVDWDRLPDHAIIYSSIHLPDTRANYFFNVLNTHRSHSQEIKIIRLDGTIWRIQAHAVSDASGIEIGKMLLLQNSTIIAAASRRMIMLAGMSAVVLLASLLGLIIVMLHRTDAGIRAQQSILRESEKQYRLLTENAISAVAVHEMILNSDGIPIDYMFINANRAFETHTGLKRDNVLGRRATEIFPAIKETPLIGIYGHVALTGVPTRFEQFFAPLDKQFQINAYSLGDLRFATIFSDVTKQRREMETRLLELDLAVQQSGDGIALTNLEANIRFVNKAWAEMHGYAVEEVLGEHLSIFHTKEQMEKEMTPSIERLSGGGTDTVKIRHRRKDGSTFLSQMTVTLAKDHRGFPFGLLLVMREISTKGKVEKRIIP